MATSTFYRGRRKKIRNSWKRKDKRIRNAQKGIQPENNKSEYDSLEILSYRYTELS